MEEQKKLNCQLEMEWKNLRKEIDTELKDLKTKLDKTMTECNSSTLLNIESTTKIELTNCPNVYIENLFVFEEHRIEHCKELGKLFSKFNFDRNKKVASSSEESRKDKEVEPENRIDT